MWPSKKGGCPRVTQPEGRLLDGGFGFSAKTLPMAIGWRESEHNPVVAYQRSTYTRTKVHNEMALIAMKNK